MDGAAATRDDGHSVMDHGFCSRFWQSRMGPRCDSMAWSVVDGLQLFYIRQERLSDRFAQQSLAGSEFVEG